MQLDGFWARFHDVAVSLEVGSHKCVKSETSSNKIEHSISENKYQSNSPTSKLISLCREDAVIQEEVDGMHIVVVELPHLLHLSYIRHVNLFDTVQ